MTTAFSPVVEKALEGVNATKYWKDLFTACNRFSKSPVDTDLTSYVTGKALYGIFYKIGLEEQKIRHAPAARATDILKKVFRQEIIVNDTFIIVLLLLRCHFSLIGLYTHIQQVLAIKLQQRSFSAPA